MTHGIEETVFFFIRLTQSLVILGGKRATKNMLCEGNILFCHPALFSL